MHRSHSQQIDWANHEVSILFHFAPRSNKERRWGARSQVGAEPERSSGDAG